jgi:predicted MFS family arabinose efflux permease
MIAAPYTRLLTMGERAESIKVGMMLAGLCNGIPMSNLDAVLAKQADGFGVPDAQGFAGGLGKAVIALALISGAPIGAVAHHIDRKVSGQTDAEKERLQRIRYYREMTRQIESGLPATVGG